RCEQMGAVDVAFADPNRKGARQYMQVVLSGQLPVQLQKLREQILQGGQLVRQRLLYGFWKQRGQFHGAIFRKHQQLGIRLDTFFHSLVQLVAEIRKRLEVVNGVL